MEEDISIINSNTRSEKIKKFIIKNKNKLIILLTTILFVVFGYFAFKEFENNKKFKIAEKFNQSTTIYFSGDKTQSKNELIEIIKSKDSTYSPLALYFIIDNNIEATNEEINRYFDIIINDINLDIEIKNLNIYKKGLFNSSFISENELLLILKPIINSDSFWKPHALILLGEFFIDKNQNQKAREFFSQVISIDTANEKLKTEAKKRLVNIGE